MRETFGGGVLPPCARRREGVVIATAFALCLLGGAMRIEDKLTAPPVAAYFIAVASCAVLPLRHRAPKTALVATTAVAMLVPALGLLLAPFIMAPALISAYSLAVRSERGSAGATLIGSSVLLVVASLAETYSWKDASRMVVVASSPMVAGLLGHATRNRRAYLAAMEERARRAEESRELEARRRVEEERLRIARELHDLVAHQITLANAQARVAAHLFNIRPEQTRKSVHEIIDTTRNALNDLRATVGLLRHSGDADPAEPAPGLSRLPALLQSFRGAGLQVSFHQEGTPRPLPPGVDLTAFRILQESLTNVTKHAGTGRAWVGLTWNRDRVTIVVADDGGGPRTNGSPGYGLIGMRERATAVGGQLSAGRRPEGGFIVRTDLPLQPARDNGATRTEHVGDAL